MNQEILHRFKTAEVVKCDTARTQQRTHTRPFVILRNHSTADRFGQRAAPHRHTQLSDPGPRTPRTVRARTPTERARTPCDVGGKEGRNRTVPSHPPEEYLIHT